MVHLLRATDIELFGMGRMSLPDILPCSGYQTYAINILHRWGCHTLPWLIVDPDNSIRDARYKPFYSTMNVRRKTLIVSPGIKLFIQGEKHLFNYWFT